MRKWSKNKKFRRLNKATYMAIILFLVMSLAWYLDLGYDEYSGTILIIQIFTMIFAIGGLRQMIGIVGDAAISDGIDLPDFGG